MARGAAARRGERVGGAESRRRPRGSRFDSRGARAIAARLRSPTSTDHEALVRVLNEHEVDDGLPPRGADTCRHSQPLAARDLGDERARDLLLLEACPRPGTETRVVVASSDKAYGDHDELPYREDFALQPRYPYDVSKACHRPDRPLVRGHLRPAGGGDAPGERLRAGRRELVARSSRTPHGRWFVASAR